MGPQPFGLQEGWSGPCSLHSRARASRRSLCSTSSRYSTRGYSGLGCTPQTSFEVVATALLRRMIPDEAEDLLAQLPALLLPELKAAARTGPDRGITRQTIERDMARRLKVEPQRAAELVSRLGHGLSEFVSEGELKDVQGQLPAHLKPLLDRAA